MCPAEMPSDVEEQSSERVEYAVRLVRAVGRHVAQPCGIRITVLRDAMAEPL